MACWLVDGVDQEAYGLQRASVVTAPMGVHRDEVAVAGRHGAVATGRAVFTPPTLVFEYLLRGAQTAIDAAATALRGLWGRREVTLTRPDGRTAVAHLVSMVPGDHSHDAYARFTVHARIPGVFFRGPEDTSQIVSITAGTPFQVLHLAGSTAPVQDAVVRVLIGATPPPSGTLSVTDVASGTGFTIESSLLASRSVFVDCATHRAWMNTSASGWSPTFPGATDISGWVAAHPAGMLEMTPRMQGADPADRRVYLVTTIGTTNVGVRARAAYL